MTPEKIGDPSEAWVKILSSEGIAIVFTLFCILVVLPAIGSGVIWSMRWLGKRGDKVIDAHLGYLAGNAAMMREIVNSTVQTHAIVADIKTGVDTLHRRFDSLNFPPNPLATNITSTVNPKPTEK